MLLNSKCPLCGDRGETIRKVTREWNKLEQKEYKIRPDGVEKGDLLGIVQETEIWAGSVLVV